METADESMHINIIVKGRIVKIVQKALTEFEEAAILAA